jgi:general secretion pathway protein F
MTTFRFEAAREDGALIRGTLDAATAPDAAGVLSARGLFPVRVETAPEPRARRLSFRTQATLLQSLASLIEAGVPIAEALTAIERVCSASLISIVRRVSARLRDGASLASALAAEGRTFSPVVTGLIRAGERGLGIGPALQQAAAYLEREAETASRMRAALAYPALLAIVGTLSVALITVFVVPRFAGILADAGQSLPTATRLLVASSTIAREYGLMLIGLFVALVAVGHGLIARQRLAWEESLLQVPLLGAIRHAFATSRAARTMGALLGVGVPALAACDVAREATGNAAVEQRLLRAKTRVAEGWSLSRALEQDHVFTAAALQLTAIGDKSGKLPALLAKAAELEEREGERRLKTLVAFLEPSLILIFAGIVAFVAAALLQAVYSLQPVGT